MWTLRVIGIALVLLVSGVRLFGGRTVLRSGPRICLRKPCTLNKESCHLNSRIVASGWTVGLTKMRILLAAS